MLPHTLDFTQHRCWFCLQTNPSYLPLCEHCGGATIPTRGENKRKLEWTVFSFGSSTPATERCPFSRFSDAMEVFDTQNRTAVRLGNRDTKYMLVRHAEHETVLFSVQEKKNSKLVRTQHWDEAEDEDRISLLRFINENLESGEGGKSDLFEPFLIFKLSVNRNFNTFYVVDELIIFLRKSSTCNL